MGMVLFFYCLPAGLLAGVILFLFSQFIFKKPFENRSKIKFFALYLILLILSFYFASLFPSYFIPSKGSGDYIGLAVGTFFVGASFGTSYLISEIIAFMFKNQFYQMISKDKNITKYHTRFRRFFSFIIDGILFVPLIWIDDLLWDSKVPLFGYFIWVLICSIIPIVYYTYSHAYFSQTIGKWVCRVRVIDYNSESRITLAQSLLRYIVPILLLPYSVYYFLSTYSSSLLNRDFEESALLVVTLILITWVLSEIICMRVNKKCRAIHDFIAKTVVVKI